MKQKSEIQEPSLLKNSEHSAHFLYPVQPQQISALDPLQKSIEDDVLQISETSIKNQSQKITLVRQIVENTFEELNDKQKLPNFLKDFKFLQDDYRTSEIIQKITNTVLLWSASIQFITNCTISIVVALLPLQIGFNNEKLEILYSIIFLMKLIQFYIDQVELVDLKALSREYAKQQLPLQIIIILAFLMMSWDDVLILQWLAYFFVFLYFMPTLNTVQYQMQKFIICGFPKQQIFSRQLCIASKVILILHILNCYLFQSLEQNKMGCSYLETLLNITIKVITLNNDTEYQNQQTSIALLVSYLSIILIITASNQQYIQSSIDLSIYFQNNNLPISIKLKIYDELMNKSNQSTHIHEQLSQELQEQIAYSQKIGFIQDNFCSYDQTTKFKLTQLCKTQYFKSGQCIMKLKQKDDNSLYYLMQGKASIQLPKQAKISLKCKSTFGQLSFFTQCLRTATIICDSNCTIYKLQRQEFLNCLTHHDKQLFQLTKDQIEFHKSLPIKCFCCQQVTHLIANCPNICYFSENCLQIPKNNNLTQPRAFCNYRLHLDRRNGVKSVNLFIHRKNQIRLKKPSDSQSYHSSSNQPLNKEEGSFIQNFDYPQSDSQRILSEKVLSEKYGPIRGQLLSSNRICSLQDAHKAIPQNIQEISNDSMSIRSLEDDKELQIGRNRKKKSFQRKTSKYGMSGQNEPNSESSLNLSPIFMGDQSNPQNQQPQRWGTIIKSQASNPLKTESVFKSGFSSFQAFSGNEVFKTLIKNPIFGNHQSKDDIDQMYIFELYYPLQNYDQIIQNSVRQI